MLTPLLLIAIGGLLGMLAPVVASKVFYGNRMAEAAMKVVGIVASVAGILMLIIQL